MNTVINYASGKPSDPLRGYSYVHELNLRQPRQIAATMHKMLLVTTVIAQGRLYLTATGAHTQNVARTQTHTRTHARTHARTKTHTHTHTTTLLPIALCFPISATREMFKVPSTYRPGTFSILTEPFPVPLGNPSKNGHKRCSTGTKNSQILF